MNPFLVREYCSGKKTDFEVLNVIRMSMRSGHSTPNYYSETDIDRNVAGVKFDIMEYLYYVDSEEEAVVFPNIDLISDNLSVNWYLLRKATLPGLTELADKNIVRLKEFTVNTSNGVLPFSAGVPEYYDYRKYQLFFCVTSKNDKKFYFEFSNYTDMVEVLKMRKVFNTKKYRWFTLNKED